MVEQPSLLPKASRLTGKRAGQYKTKSKSYKTKSDQVPSEGLSNGMSRVTWTLVCGTVDCLESSKRNFRSSHCPTSLSSQVVS